MGMEAGITDTIEYMAPGANPRRTAVLTATDVKSPGVPILESTDDPDWVVFNPHDGTNQKVRSMEYVNPGGNYSAVISADYEGGGPADTNAFIKFIFIHSKIGNEGGGPPLSIDHRMDIQGWDGRWWRITIPNVGRPYPRQPKFNVEPLQLP